ncbi:DUF4202 family protein [Nitrosomonas ureae]|uniref:Uncharacterized protein n=1 Tax=Nitrosomonas ureae TaxID=44577 RepID=A0A1H9H7G2_9PROT|nr:DUF4202 family protein [Nitrosomonas ureae]SEQ58275.1 protein of unknown function [Nitrosomonas ureae]
MTRQNFDKVKALIDAANNEDPNQEICEDKILPKDLLYSQPMSDMLERYSSDADDAIKLAVRTPRSTSNAGKRHAALIRWIARVIINGERD